MFIGKSTLFCSIVFLMLIACQKVEIIDKNNLNIGYWEFFNSSEEESGTTYHMKRIDYFRDKYGTILFSEDGHFYFQGSWGFIPISMWI